MIYGHVYMEYDIYRRLFKLQGSWIMFFLFLWQCVASALFLWEMSMSVGPTTSCTHHFWPSLPYNSTPNTNSVLRRPLEKFSTWREMSLLPTTLETSALSEWLMTIIKSAFLKVWWWGRLCQPLTSSIRQKKHWRSRSSTKCCSESINISF